MCVLDEYGYYAVEGFAVVPAQARSLGFSAIFAGQDLPAFEKASKEEAASTLANTNTRLCGKLECTKTYAFFKEVAGTGTFTQVQRYERKPDALEPAAFKAEDGISIDRVDRVSFEALRGQDSGQWHLFFANTILRVRSFFSNPKPVKNLRVNHFIKVGRPDSDEIAAFRNTYDLFTRAVSADGGLMSFMDRVSPPQDMEDISNAFKMFQADGALLRAGKVLAYCAQAEGIRARAFSQINAAAFDVGIQELDEPQELDFTRQMAGAGVEPDEGGMFIDSAPAAGDGEQVVAQVNERRGLFQEDPYLERPAEANGFGGGEDGGHLEDIDDQLYGGIPGDVANIGSGAAEWQGDGLTPDFIDDASAATRGPLVPAKAADSAQFFDQTSVFGADNYEVPGAVLDADNDADTDALDRPSDVAHAGDGDGDLVDIDMAEFAAPMADEGLLSREATISGLAAIERAVGAPETESLMTASAVAESIGDATKYPITPPSTKPDLTRFEAVARRLSHVLSVAADSDE
jgi:intracellular multiplication protein IcmO